MIRVSHLFVKVSAFATQASSHVVPGLNLGFLDGIAAEAVGVVVAAEPDLRFEPHDRVPGAEVAVLMRADEERSCCRGQDRHRKQRSPHVGWLLRYV